MIVKTEFGWQVVSKLGKPLSGNTLTEDEAKKRLRQIEAFKHMRQAQIPVNKVKAKVVPKAKVK